LKALIQRVSRAAIDINGKPAGTMKHGLVVLLGITHADTPEDARWLAAKISGLRVFNDPEGVMNLNVNEVSGSVMVVSQFTLHASTKKGNRPSYIAAARPEHAIPLYEYLISSLSELVHEQVLTGSFGAHMDIHLTNDGPVTIMMDTHNKI
jgi:D-tyrosyl-tRNA(Tyr) deacylase